MRTATNTLGDTFATIETVNSDAGPFFNVRLEREGLSYMRIQIAHSDIEPRTKRHENQNDLIENHLAQSLARFGFTKEDLKQ